MLSLFVLQIQAAAAAAAETLKPVDDETCLQNQPSIVLVT